MVARVDCNQVYFGADFTQKTGQLLKFRLSTPGIQESKIERHSFFSIVDELNRFPETGQCMDSTHKGV